MKLIRLVYFDSTKICENEKWNCNAALRIIYFESMKRTDIIM